MCVCVWLSHTSKLRGEKLSFYVCLCCFFFMIWFPPRPLPFAIVIVSQNYFRVLVWYADDDAFSCQIDFEYVGQTHSENARSSGICILLYYKSSVGCQYDNSSISISSFIAFEIIIVHFVIEIIISNNKWKLNKIEVGNCKFK